MNPTNATIDIVEEMSIEEGKAFYQRIIALAKGERLPRKDAPIEIINAEVWQSLRAKDKRLANDVLNGAIVSYEAQVDSRRTGVFTDIGKYLEHTTRERAVA